MDATKIAEELKFLSDNPQFEERPATLLEFLGPDYLGIEDRVRASIKRELSIIMGDEVNPLRPTKIQLAIVTGAIGTGKTTIASIVLPYLAHWVLCLKDPQGFFNLLPGSRIAFMQMSTSEGQAAEVVFGDIKARIQYSPWFANKYPYDPKFSKQLRFPKDIWVLPGDSAETTFEGYNICVDSETTIFTNEGWKRYDEVQVGDLALTLNHVTGMSEWQPIDAVNVMPDMRRELTLMEGSAFSSLSTPDHKWPVVTESDVRKWRTTETLGFSDGIVLSAERADLPEEQKYTDSLVEAVAWFWTEGSIVGKSGGVIYQKYGTRNADRIRACLTKLFGPPVDAFATTRSSRGDGPKWRENVNNSNCSRTGKPKGLSEFRLSVDAGEELLHHAPNRVPTHGFLMSLTRSQLELFIDVSLRADNCGENMLAQKSPEMAEAFAFACILSGRSVSIRLHKTPGRDYDMTLVRVRSKKVARPVASSRKSGKFTIEKITHDGIVWCPTLPNSTWLARRNGSVYFTGNCGGILDEADSHKVTKNKDYAETGYTTIASRIESRFEDRGFLLVIGQMKKGNGFAAKKYQEFKNRDDAYAVRMSIWESMGWDHYRDKVTGEVETFFYDAKRKMIVPKGIKTLTRSEQIIEIPVVFKNSFTNDPEKALRDLAGIPPAVGDPFINLTHKIEEAKERWVVRHNTDEAPVDPEGRIQPWFKNTTTSLKRVGHLDLAYSGQGDALGFALGHVREVIEIDGELKPYIIIDLLYRIQAPKGTEIFLGDVRRFIYSLKDDFKFKIDKVTMDGFQSTDTKQQLKKKRIPTDTLSVDKDVLPYHDLREALYENRIEFPPYMVKYKRGDTQSIDIMYKELTELINAGDKIDHPPDGSKDVADAVAGVVCTLMGDRRYHKKVTQLSDYREQREAVGQSHSPFGNPTLQHPAYNGGGELPSAPVPPPMTRGPFR